MTGNETWPSRLSRAVDKSEIEDVIVSYCRSADRGDYARMREAFHPGAHVEMGYYTGSAEGFCDRFEALAALKTTGLSRVQHQASNIHCVIAGDRADVEFYMRLCRRQEKDAEQFDQIIASRALDEFERRDGRWAIVRRRVIWDWMISVPASPSFWEAGPGQFHLGGRGDDDLSAEVFPITTIERRIAESTVYTPQP